jgi:putative tryptophan/tyrosine transport system substrate-binding protein
VGGLTVLSRRAVVRGMAGLGVSAAGLLLSGGCGLGALAPEPTRVRYVGFISSDPPDSPWVVSLWDGLRERGWVEGHNLAVERRMGGSQDDPAPVAELLTMGVDVLVTVGSPRTLMAKAATTSTPIVFASISDPVGVGAVANLARPGGNVTGVSQGASTQLNGKRLELLATVVPGLSKVASIQDAANPPANAVGLAATQQAASVLGVEVQALEARTADDLESVFATAARWQANGFVIGQSGLFFKERARIAELAAGVHLPGMYQTAEMVEAGGLMAYGSRQSELYRRLSPYVDKVLRGAKPADLPVEQLTTVEFVVNVTTAGALGLTFPPDVAEQITLRVQ